MSGAGRGAQGRACPDPEPRTWKEPRRASVEDLRRAFDERFAEPFPEIEDDGEELLAIRVAGDPFAIRLSEIGGIASGRPITALPGGGHALLGLAGVRGRVVAVHDLARVLGYTKASASSRWLLVCRANADIALSIGELEGHVRARRADLGPAPRGARGAGVVEAALKDGGEVREVLGVDAILAAVVRASGAAAGGGRHGA